MSEELELHDLRVVRGRGEPEERAAAIASLHSALFEAADHGIADAPAKDAWAASQRPIRSRSSIRRGEAARNP